MFFFLINWTISKVKKGREVKICEGNFHIIQYLENMLFLFFRYISV